MTPALTAKQSVLAATALCGELSPLALARLIPSQSYRYHVAEELTQAKLLRTYRKDRVKGYRLTRRAKELLAGQQPERYAALFTGSVRTNSYPSELSRRLRMHRLGETLTMMQLCGVRIFADERPAVFAGCSLEPDALPAFYPAREVQALGDAAIKIKNARMAGVLLTPEHFYLVYNTGGALMRWTPASELRARTLLSEYLGRRLGWEAYAGQSARALLLGESMTLFPALLQSRGSGKRQLFYLDGTFEHLHYLPQSPQGDAVLRLLLHPKADPALRRAMTQTFLPKQTLGNFAYDALDESGRPVLFAWDFDLVRIQSFALGLGSRGSQGLFVAFDFQAEALRRYCGLRAEVRPLSLAKTERIFLHGS